MVEELLELHLQIQQLALLSLKEYIQKHKEREKRMKAEQLFINILSLSIFPFVAKPLIMAFANADEATYNQLMEERKTEVAHFIINSIKSYE